jgi:hypothetical protein
MSDIELTLALGLVALLIFAVIVLLVEREVPK